jgi:hypothetical protein
MAGLTTLGVVHTAIALVGLTLQIRWMRASPQL